MRYTFLGRSGLRVSELCLGTMSFGEAWGFGADEKESHRILDAFAEAGGNFVDTANKYHEGQSEEIIGGYLGADRDRWVVASKYTLAMRLGGPELGWQLAQEHARVGRGEPAPAAHRLPRRAVGARLGLRDADRGDHARGRRPGPGRQGALHRAVRRAGVAGRAGEHIGRATRLEPVRRDPGPVQPDRAHGGARAASGGRGVRDVGDRVGADGGRRADREVQPRQLDDARRQPARGRERRPAHRAEPAHRPRGGPRRRRPGCDVGPGGGRLGASTC